MPAIQVGDRKRSTPRPAPTVRQQSNVDAMMARFNFKTGDRVLPLFRHGGSGTITSVRGISNYEVRWDDGTTAIVAGHGLLPSDVPKPAATSRHTVRVPRD